MDFSPKLMGRAPLAKLLCAGLFTATLAACGDPGNGSSSASSVSSIASSQQSSVSSISSSEQSSASSLSSSEQSSVSSAISSESSSSASSVSSVPTDPNIGNLLESDGTFAQGQGLFIGDVFAGVNASFSWDGEVNVTINDATEEGWHVQLLHALPVTENERYTICFSGQAAATRSIAVNVDQGAPNYGGVMEEGAFNPTLSSGYQDYKYTFTANETNNSARLTFNFGLDTADVQLDNIGVYSGEECGNPSLIAEGPTGSGSANIDFSNGVPPITTEGNQVLFGGQQGSVAGVSLFWSNFVPDGGIFYTDAVVDTLRNDWNSRLVRAAMGVEDPGGYLQDAASNRNRVTTVVDAAIRNDMYVIIDWHSHNAEYYTEQAISFFQDMANTYGHHNNIIYEVYNEPDCPAAVFASGEDCTWDTKTPWPVIKEYAEQVIAAIREIDNDNLIIVGTPFYSQFVDEASEDPINDHNVAYTLHFYAGSHNEGLRNRARTALRNGVPLFVTEWGTVDADGDGAVDRAESDRWMQFLYDNNISHANWSLSNKDEGASILRPGTPGQHGWSDSDLTESGQYVKDQIIDW